MNVFVILVLALIILILTITLISLIRLKQKIKDYLNEINIYEKQKKELVLEILNSKASSKVMRLQHELKKIDIKLSSLNTLYNDNLIIYNTKISKFPLNIISSLFGFKKIC